MSAIGPKLAICRLGLLLALAPSLTHAAKTTDDYLQPYKFVKPLKDLEELYSKHAPAAESRGDTGKEGRTEEVPSKLEKKILMTDELEVPDLATGDETLPRAQPLRDLKGRTRKRTSASDSKARLDNHKTDESEDEVVEAEDDLEGEEMEVLPDVVAERSGQAAKETGGPKAEPLKGKPYYSDDDYYYYYYDDEYYDDDEPYEQEIATRRKEETRYPNFPPTKSRQTRPPTRPTTTRRTTRKPASRYSKPKSNPYSSHKYNQKKSQSSSRSPEYNIASTIERLKAIKRQQELKRNGVPSLPNPWERLNKYSSHKTKKDHRKGSEERRQQRPRHSHKTPKPSPDYYDDYYYDHAPWPQKRQGYAEPRQTSNPLALLVAPLAGIALLTAAAAVAINPVLISVSVTGKRRKRRDLDTVIQANQSEGISPELEEKIHEMQVLEKFMSTVPENTNYQQQVLSMYLSCSGYEEITNACLDRVVCEYANEESDVEQEERDVISIVLYNIMANDYVSEDFKDRLRVAARSGRDKQTCLAFECAALNPGVTNTLD